MILRRCAQRHPYPSRILASNLTQEGGGPILVVETQDQSQGNKR